MANADPSQVGGPNQDAAIIDYPAHTTGNYHIPYNYLDTVNIEWFSYAANATETTMQIWYWASTMGPKESYKPLTQYVVPVNGTLAFNLNGVPKIDGGYYLGQWNLNFTRVDKAPITGLTLSQPFNCSFDDSKAAVTYSPQGAVTGTPSSAPSSTSSASQTASSTPTSQSSQSNSNTDSNSASSAVSSDTSSPTAGVLSFASGAAAAQPSTTAVASTGLSGGAIAGIIIGVLLALVLGALGAFFFLRRKRAAAADQDQVPPGYGQYGPATPHSQYPPADAYKQQMAAYHASGAAGVSPGMPPMAPAMVAAGHHPPQQPEMKSQYVAQQQEQYYQQQAYAQQQQAQAAMYAQQQPQAGGFVSELPTAHHRGGFDGVPAQHTETAPAFRQELPAERYS